MSESQEPTPRQPESTGEPIRAEVEVTPVEPGAVEPPAAAPPTRKTPEEVRSF